MMTADVLRASRGGVLHGHSGVTQKYYQDHRLSPLCSTPSNYSTYDKITRLETPGAAPGGDPVTKTASITLLLSRRPPLDDAHALCNLWAFLLKQQGMPHSRPNSLSVRVLQRLDSIPT